MAGKPTQIKVKTTRGYSKPVATTVNGKTTEKRGPGRPRKHETKTAPAKAAKPATKTTAQEKRPLGKRPEPTKEQVLEAENKKLARSEAYYKAAYKRSVAETDKMSTVLSRVENRLKNLKKYVAAVDQEHNFNQLVMDEMQKSWRGRRAINRAVKKLDEKGLL
ncbi:hypothetical protein MPC38_06655 [Prescottella equi]|uniref:hypothetical protein n=1 Tax=Rhodococcus hoagii TaxID=43767 RepID=UPI001F5BC649|nr:hypothetical protein [Prescottella equi]UNQ40925.1 hypothetical protein MPC38_06655 [Prescottella equi]